jgi:hypothetical protein
MDGIIKDKKINIGRTNWIKASFELSFKIISPYIYQNQDKKIKIFAYLPEYGSQNGALVDITFPPGYEINKDIKETAEIMECFYSCINIDECQNYDENYFKETLNDWGMKNERK